MILLSQREECEQWLPSAYRTHGSYELGVKCTLGIFASSLFGILSYPIEAFIGVVKLKMA